MNVKKLKGLEFKPLTVEEWEDLERLFNENHRFNGCWCMYQRTERKDFDVGLHGALFHHISL